MKTMKKEEIEICTLDDEWNKRIDEALSVPLPKLTVKKSVKKSIRQKNK